MVQNKSVTNIIRIEMSDSATTTIPSMNNKATDNMNKAVGYMKNRMNALGMPSVVLFLLTFILIALMFIPNRLMPNYGQIGYSLIIVLSVINVSILLMKTSNTNLFKNLYDALFLVIYYMVYIAPIIALAVIYFRFSNIIYSKYETGNTTIINNFMIFFIILQSILFLHMFANVMLQASSSSSPQSGLVNINNKLSLAYQMILMLINIFLAKSFSNNYNFFTVDPNN